MTHNAPHVNQPSTYDGRPLCMRCGKDPSGDYWPICADIKPSGEKYTHEESCAVYGEHDWMCDRCERDLEEA